jgi:hypothetical protein
VTFFLQLLNWNFQFLMVIPWLVIHQKAKIGRWYKNLDVALVNIRSACQKRLKGLKIV